MAYSLPRETDWLTKLKILGAEGISGSQCRAGGLKGSRTLRPQDTSAPQNWCRSVLWPKCMSGNRLKPLGADLGGAVGVNAPTKQSQPAGASCPRNSTLKIQIMHMCTCTNHATTSEGGKWKGTLALRKGCAPV